MGWLKAPPIDRRYILITLAVVLLSVPFAYYRVYLAVPELKEIRDAIHPFWTKTDYGALRYVHFMALAYLAYCAVGEGGRRLFQTGLAGRIIDTIRMVGQQSLAVFVTSIVLAQILGFVWDQIGRNHWTMLVVNLFGFACLIATAKVVTWFKSEPWRRTFVESKKREGAAAQPAAVQPAE